MRRSLTAFWYRKATQRAHTAKTAHDHGPRSLLTAKGTLLTTIGTNALGTIRARDIEDEPYRRALMEGIDSKLRNSMQGIRFDQLDALSMLLGSDPQSTKEMAAESKADYASRLRGIIREYRLKHCEHCGSTEHFASNVCRG